VLVLAFDTATAVASVAVSDGSVLLAELDGPAEVKHGEMLLSVVEAALARAKVTLAQVELLAAGIGPGSFTGVRVGLATAKGLALATGKPLVGVVSLRAMGRGAADTSGGSVAPVLDAYRNEVYSALYQVRGDGKLVEQLPPLNQPPKEAAKRMRQVTTTGPIILCGNGARRYREQFSAHLGASTRWAELLYDTPRAGALAHEAIAVFQEHGPSDLLSLEPLYLRPSDAQLPRYVK
jgi:tRNA threonylcarbamoyladenosine biosynthesis protein TsaB